MARRATEPEHDPTRREFFKTFSRQTIQNAGAVAGAASELRRTSLAAARELLDMNTVATDEPITRTVASTPAQESAPQETFRSAYRFSGDAVVILDQRELPERVITFECRAPNEVASALRSGAVTPGPVMGQIAAYGVALAAVLAAERTPDRAEQFIRGAADEIRSGRGEVHAVRAAVTRMMSRHDDLANAGAGTNAVRDALVATADEIAAESVAACAAIARAWSELVVDGEEIDLFVHGDSGPLACGMVGMSTAGMQALIDPGSRVHVWVADGSPTGEGTRITALQLIQLDIPHTVIPDSAIGWLMASRQLSAVVLRGDTVSSNGDAATLLGALSVAQVASDANVPVYVLAPEVSWNRVARDASELQLDVRSAAELGSAVRARLNPPFDVVPARLVSAYVSELSVIRPPFMEPR